MCLEGSFVGGGALLKLEMRDDAGRFNGSRLENDSLSVAYK